MTIHVRDAGHLLSADFTSLGTDWTTGDFTVAIPFMWVEAHDGALYSIVVGWTATGASISFVLQVSATRQVLMRTATGGGTARVVGSSSNLSVAQCAAGRKLCAVLTRSGTSMNLYVCDLDDEGTLLVSGAAATLATIDDLRRIRFGNSSGSHDAVGIDYMIVKDSALAQEDVVSVCAEMAAGDLIAWHRSATAGGRGDTLAMLGHLPFNTEPDEGDQGEAGGLGVFIKNSTDWGDRDGSSTVNDASDVTWHSPYGSTADPNGVFDVSATAQTAGVEISEAATLEGASVGGHRYGNRTGSGRRHIEIIDQSWVVRQFSGATFAHNLLGGLVLAHDQDRVAGVIAPIPNTSNAWPWIGSGSSAHPDIGNLTSLRSRNINRLGFSSNNTGDTGPGNVYGIPGLSTFRIWIAPTWNGEADRATEDADGVCLDLAMPGAQPCRVTYGEADTYGGSATYTEEIDAAQEFGNPDGQAHAWTYEDGVDDYTPGTPSIELKDASATTTTAVPEVGHIFHVVGEDYAWITSVARNGGDDGYDLGLSHALTQNANSAALDGKTIWVGEHAQRMLSFSTPRTAASGKFRYFEIRPNNSGDMIALDAIGAIFTDRDGEVFSLGGQGGAGYKQFVPNGVGNASDQMYGTAWRDRVAALGIDTVFIHATQDDVDGDGDDAIEYFTDEAIAAGADGVYVSGSLTNGTTGSTGYYNDSRKMIDWHDRFVTTHGPRVGWPVVTALDLLGSSEVGVMAGRFDDQGVHYNGVPGLGAEEVADAWRLRLAAAASLPASALVRGSRSARNARGRAALVARN